MKIEVISNKEWFIFVNSLYIKITNYNNKDEIVSVVKSLIIKLKNRLKLRGFYKIKVYVKENIGLFIELLKLEDIDRVDGLDLRVIVYFDEDIYFKTDDFFIIFGLPNIRYFNGYYYCLVDDMFDINMKGEFGEFVYGNEVMNVIDKGILI